MVNHEILTNHQQLNYPVMILRLLQRYPDTPVLQVEQPTDMDNFIKQRTKQNEYPIEGGAIGIITIPDGKLVLSKRSGPNSGWALPGGRVEIGEEFDSAMIREVEEETGLAVAVDLTLTIEYKTFALSDGQSLNIWLAVFKGHVVSGDQPRQTEEAVKEGLEIGVFTLDTLPDDMLISDKQKILDFFK